MQYQKQSDFLLPIHVRIIFDQNLSSIRSHLGGAPEVQPFWLYFSVSSQHSSVCCTSVSNIPYIPPFAVLQCQHSLHSTVCCTSVSNIPYIPPFAVLQCQHSLHSTVCCTSVSTFQRLRHLGGISLRNGKFLGEPPRGKKVRGGSLTSRPGYFRYSNDQVV